MAEINWMDLKIAPEAELYGESVIPSLRTFLTALADKIGIDIVKSNVAAVNFIPGDNSNIDVHPGKDRYLLSIPRGPKVKIMGELLRKHGIVGEDYLDNFVDGVTGCFWLVLDKKDADRKLGITPETGASADMKKPSSRSI